MCYTELWQSSWEDWCAVGSAPIEVRRRKNGSYGAILDVTECWRAFESVGKGTPQDWVTQTSYNGILSSEEPRSPELAEKVGLYLRNSFDFVPIRLPPAPIHY